MMGKQKVRINLVGQTFGYLTVLEFAGTDKWGNALWKCKCSLDGNEVAVLGNSLRRGLTKSCGCGSAQKGVNNPRYKHGQAGIKVRTPEYNAWISMNRRCSDLKSKDYPDYGGRGITVCARWKKSFENFFTDMGLRPSSKHSLDRKENNGNYEPRNCRWATTVEQARNRRTRRCPHCGKALYNERYAKD